MWIFLSDAFLSIVADQRDSDRFMVRARFKGDIQRVFPDAEVKRTTSADYRYRASVSRPVVVAAITKELGAIDYHNFKDTVGDDLRHQTYSRVWSVMYSAQAEAEPRRRRRKKKTREEHEPPRYEAWLDWLEKESLP